MEEKWAANARFDLICVDSYDGDVPKGRLQSLGDQTSEFSSLSQLLIRLEERLEQAKHIPPRPHRFCRELVPALLSEDFPMQRKGKLATFRLKVLFQQHTSWQGILQWHEGQQEESFRSVLELVILMDSALKKSGTPS